MGEVKRISNTIAICRTKPGCFVARGINDADVRRAAKNHEDDCKHKVEVWVE